MCGHIDKTICVSFETIRPVILQGQHDITNLLNKINLHRNHETIMTAIGQKFVVLRL